jgi:hypothetical protein
MQNSLRVRNLLLLVFFFATAVQLTFALDASPHPRIVFAESRYDFGTVVEGTKVTHAFAVTNAGDADLRIQSIVPGCGCTVGVVENELIAPGASTNIQITFDTTGFSGAKTRVIRVYSSDINTPTSLLTITGIVDREVTISPQVIRFENVQSGEERNADFVVAVRPGSNARILEVKSNHPAFAIEAIEKNDQAYRMRVRLQKDVNSGELRGRAVAVVTGTSQHSGPRYLNIPLFASVRADLELKPNAVSFGVIDAKGPLVRRSVRLVNHAVSSPLKILEVTPNNEALKGSIKEIQPGKIYVVDVELDPSRIKDVLKSSIQLKTNNERSPILTLNVYGVLPPAIR